MPLVDQFGRPMQSTQQRAMSARRQARRAELNAAYDAAQTTSNNSKHWRLADSLSAAAANSADVRRTLRERARYEAANNSFASGIVDTLANDTISTGPRIQVLLKDKPLARLIERRFHDWAKAVNLAAKLRTARRAKAVDGECFIMAITNHRLRTKVQLDVKLVETDQIEDPTVSTANVSGIDYDDDGNPISYKLLPAHPGDVLLTSKTRVKPIDAANMIHVFRSDRPGQGRGIPEITPALPLFAMLRRFTLAVLQAAETAADFAAVLETAADSYDDDGNPFAEEIDNDAGIPIEFGTMVSLPRGHKLNQMKAEQPTTTYEMFRNAVLNEIARCVHMPANKARCDSSGYNFASGKLDHGTYYASLDVERNFWEIEALDRIFYWWLDEALLIPGYIDSLESTEEGVPHNWYWPPHPSGDPTKEANALATLHALGLVDEDSWLVSQGVDPEEFWERKKEQIERRLSLGLAPAQYYLTPDQAPAGSGN